MAGCNRSRVPSTNVLQLWPCNRIPAGFALHVADTMTDTTNRSTSKFRVVSSYLLFAVVAGAPFPFGSDNPTAIAFWCLVLGLAVFAAAISIHGLRAEQLMLLGGIALIVL